MIQDIAFIGISIVASIAGCAAFHWHRRAERLNDFINTSRQVHMRARDNLRQQLERAETRARINASAWGRVMGKLRMAESANKKLRTDQLRRQLQDGVDLAA